MAGFSLASRDNSTPRTLKTARTSALRMQSVRAGCVRRAGGLPRYLRITGDSASQSGLDLLTAVYRHGDNFSLTGFRVDVVTPVYSLEAPACLFQAVAELRPCYRLQTAISRTRMFDSGSCPCSRRTSRTPLIASRIFSSSSCTVSPWE